MIFHFFTNETASLTYNSNNNTPTPQASENGKRHATSSMAFLKFHKLDETWRATTGRTFFFHTHSKGIEMNCIFWEEFLLLIDLEGRRWIARWHIGQRDWSRWRRIKHTKKQKQEKLWAGHPLVVTVA
jgi:hypothetical protein